MPSSTARPSRAVSARPNSSRSDRHSRPERSHGASGHSSAPRQPRPARTPAARPRSIWDDLPIQQAPTGDLPTFAELGLPEGLAQTLAKRGMKDPFPIQAATIPDALAGRDVLGRAATGSGKTLAFGLPTIARLEGRVSRPRHPRALVLVPTRELAMQVVDSLSPLANARSLSVRLVAGGLSIVKQVNAMAAGVDILVATPGRLIDLLERKSVFLDDVQVSVLDEADHMADLGFLPVVRRLLDLTPPRTQRLLFSATLDGDVATLVERYLTDPVAHALAPVEAAVDTMSHYVFTVSRDQRPEVIAQLAAREGRTIMFVRTKHGADRLAKQLAMVGVRSAALHGGRSQSQRTRALEAFRDGSVPALVATDVAARGIHVDDVSLVVHIDPPGDGKDYLHRSGRTARAGSAGTVVSLVLPEESRAYERMLRASSVPATYAVVASGDEVLSTVAGARKPSGVSVVEPRPAQNRPSRGAGQQNQAHTRRPRPTESHGRPSGGSRGGAPRKAGTHAHA